MVKLYSKLKEVTNSPSIPNSWKQHYEYAQETIPSHTIIYLEDKFLDKINNTIRLSKTNIMYLQEAMMFVRKDEKLRFLFWLWHCILFRKKSEEDNEIVSWPLPKQPNHMKGKIKGIFPALVILSGYHSVLSIYREIGNIPQNIVSDTLTTVEEYMNIFREENGYHGLTLFHLNRLLQHFRAELFRIGRLEYHMIKFNHPITVFHNKYNEQKIALSKQGIRYRNDGHVDGTNNFYVEKNLAWDAEMIETEHYIKGNPICKSGYASNNMITLQKGEWESVLEVDDHVLGVHIPRKGVLSQEVCVNSFKQSEVFFKKYFPHIKFKAFVCVSWMLDPELQSLLNEESNLIKFQKLFNLFPVKSMDHTIYKFVFRTQPGHIEELPEDTFLQRKIKEFMLSGGSMHTGGGFIIIE